MKARAFRIPLLIAALSIAATISLQAAPSLPITKGPVAPLNLTGPLPDPAATNGQWFSAAGVEEYRTHEFHDEYMEYGGGYGDSYAISGTVPPGSILYTNGTDIVGFDIEATVYNDTDSAFGDASPSDNQHGESRPAMTQQEFYTGTLAAAKLVAEFAIADTNLLPSAFNPPYNQVFPYIIADNEDQLAWYCWSPADPPGGSEPGNYYVPTWDFGDIPVGHSGSRILSFTVDPPMTTADPRYNHIIASHSDGIDLFANRTTSLKISTWIDVLGSDENFPFPENMLRNSDVSVFHNEPEPYVPTHKMHWPQLPDPNGWDVRASHLEWGPDQMQKVLADDFLCTSNGPITAITFWGSFEFDGFNPFHDFGGITNFHLSLHKDIPADPPLVPYSMPVIPAEWEWDIDPFNLPPGWAIAVTPEAPSTQGWYDPNTGQFEEENHSQYFRYEVTIPANDAFEQIQGTIYWLDISVRLGESEAMWGWKTSVSEHFNDDAVWADLPVTNLMQWGELRDPITGESLDLAFVIDGGEEEPQYEQDFGDLPDAYNTLLANNGAFHQIVAGTLMGASIDAEPDGQPDPQALGDDNDIVFPPPNDDEDGVVFTSPLIPGQLVQFNATVSVPGQLDVWLDADNSGNWSGGDLVFSGGVAAGSNPLSFLVPITTASGQNHARFRFNTGGPLPPTGGAQDGEVEDYEVYIEELDWGDAPDPNYPTLAASSGANHTIAGGLANALRLGNLIDAEPDGQPDPNALGDDNANLADEDGITPLTPLIPGTWAQVSVSAGFGGSGLTGTAYLQGWIDFNIDGDWLDGGEQIFTDVLLSPLPGTYSLSFLVPSSATNGPTFARFRLSTVSGIAQTGWTQDGEVEDYEYDLLEPQEIDWGDAYDHFHTPVYPTLLMHNGAHHVIQRGMYLGNGEDPEPDGQPNLPANGDDINMLTPGIPYPPGDEDGVIFTTALQPGGFAGVDVLASLPGVLDAWIDFNNDGDWADAGERIFSAQPLAAGTNALLFAVPVSTVQGSPVVSRFRYSSGGVASFTGLALDGEVEDHLTPDIMAIEQGDDLGDADLPYPTLLPAGALHIITPGVMLGATIDAEPDGQPHPQALGDDFGPPLDDEDGITFVGKVVAGSNGTVNVVAGTSGGVLDAWIDFNKDGIWADPGERLFGGPQPLVPGSNPGLTFSVPWPPSLTLGPNPTFARFRISLGGGLPPTGAAPDGEVEDYTVDLYQPIPTNLVITNLTFNASNTVATVEWTVENNITYQMESNTNLVTGSWIPAGSTVLGPLNSQTNNMSTETSKFYRVTAPWTP